jgi:hypothetical protein
MALVLVMVLIFCGSAMAFDTAACGDWEGCIGRFEQHELGDFDASGVWQWNITDPDLLADIALNAVQGDNGTHNWSTGTLLTPHKTGISIDWAKLRNKVGPSSKDYPDMANGPVADIQMLGSVDAVNVPEVWKMDSEWGVYFMVAHYFKPYAEDICNDNGWDSPECWETYQDNDGDGLEDNDGGVMFYKSGGVELNESNVASITWAEKAVTVEPRPTLTDHYIFMKYEMGQNILEDKGLYHDRNLYFKSFGPEVGPATVGLQTFVLLLKDGRNYTFTLLVESNRLLPTVASTITNTVGVYKETKSGKKIDNRHDVITNNMTAREITDEDGATRLLIQWAEPDLAMMLSEYSKDVRLRMYVGNNWNIPSPTTESYFLFMDVPVTSGSVVVPPDAYAWIKAQVLANGESQLQVSGMYREQFSQFHNRGYMGTVLFPIQ